MMVRRESPALAGPQSPMGMGPCLEAFSSSRVRSTLPSSLAFTGNSGSGSERGGDLNLGTLWEPEGTLTEVLSPESLEAEGLISDRSTEL